MKPAQEEFVPKLTFKLTDEEYSHYTLAPIFIRFLAKFLHLPELFLANLSLKKRNRRYSVDKIAFSVVNLLALGIERFAHLSDRFYLEKEIASCLGLKDGFFKEDTAYRFLRSFRGWHIKQLERINHTLLAQNLDLFLPKRGNLYLDLDMSTKSTDGEKMEKAVLGYNRKYPGKNCLQWTVAFLAKVALLSKLGAGNIIGKSTLKKDLEDTDRSLKKLNLLNGILARLIYRVDGGYFSKDNLELLSRRRFITRGSSRLVSIRKRLAEIPKGKLNWRQFNQTTSFIDLGKMVLFEEASPTRVIWIRQATPKKRADGRKKKPKTVFFPLISNLCHWKSTALIKAYRGRQVIENHFKETNQAFHSNKLPSGSFRGNEAYLWFVTLAYNCLFFFRHHSVTNLLPEDELEDIKKKTF